jgi:DNA-binding CsgD family transcriptional regulator
MAIEWRRSKILELSSKGNNQTEIALILQIGEATVNRDLSFIRNQARSTIKEYIYSRVIDKW